VGDRTPSTPEGFLRGVYQSPANNAPIPRPSPPSPPSPSDCANNPATRPVPPHTSSRPPCRHPTPPHNPPTCRRGRPRRTTPRPEDRTTPHDSPDDDPDNGPHTTTRDPLHKPACATTRHPCTNPPKPEATQEHCANTRANTRKPTNPQNPAPEQRPCPASNRGTKPPGDCSKKSGRTFLQRGKDETEHQNNPDLCGAYPASSLKSKGSATSPRREDHSTYSFTRGLGGPKIILVTSESDNPTPEMAIHTHA
jgi:hypothetical protein